jgi:2-polyprenyl-3-methyl-5-hydroxy-6-metoxy-1,4-benzoquinol methylase
MNQTSPTHNTHEALREKHVYDYKVIVGANTAPALVVRMVGNDNTVLEVGSGPGAITRVLSTTNKCRVTALEVDPDAIEIVKEHCELVVAANLNDFSWPEKFIGKKFDRVVAADVLEHVQKPLDVLVGMKTLLSQQGQIIVSLPHVGHAGVICSLFESDFAYRDWGLLDRTHIRFFGLKNIDTLFQAAGLSILEVEFVVRHPLETEFAPLWLQLSMRTQKAILRTTSAYVYQVVVRAVPSERGSKAINVSSTDIAVPRPSYLSIVKRFMPSPIKQALKRVLKR